jgi:chromosomal replication initiator protein
MPAAIASAPPELLRSWRAVLGMLEDSVNRSTFNTWLRGTAPLRADGRVIAVAAPHGADTDWLNRQLSCVMTRAVQAIFGDGFSARFVPQAVAFPAPAPLPPVSNSAAHAASPAPQGSVIGILNRDYTFERYIQAAGNRLALQACMDLLSARPRAASPVVMYGAPGLGKTHLLHALAARAAAQGMSVVCLGASDFTDRYLSAINADRVSEFQALVRNAQLLLIDDLQFFVGRRGTAHEFAQTLEVVANAGGLVACASECNPEQLSVPARLISRLKAGVLAPMHPLEADDRRAYVAARAREERLALPAWATDRIAACEAPSIRVLQGVVNTALALQRAGNLEPRTLDDHLSEFCGSSASAPQALDTHGLIEAVATHCGVTVDELVGRGRTRQVANARAIAMAALVAQRRSLAQVAAIFDGRDKSTVKEASDRGRVLLESEPALCARIMPDRP